VVGFARTDGWCIPATTRWPDGRQITARGGGVASDRRDRPVVGISLAVRGGLPDQGGGGLRGLPDQGGGGLGSRHGGGARWRRPPAARDGGTRLRWKRGCLGMAASRWSRTGMAASRWSMKNKTNISVREGERKQKWLVTLESFQKLTCDHRI
jgi:hypothetical protein